ncbi:MAG: methyl-accepting chemotaxis protein, partial [Leptospira sp.]|nr:methyl-accepting chemotaxis protein [Leptospira sp.]
GDYYWVDANAAPRYENGEIVGFMSVRRKPSRDQVSAASDLYRKILSGKVAFPKSDKSKISIRAKMWIKMTATTLLTLGIALLAIFKADPSYIVGLSVITAVFFCGYSYSMMRYILGPIKAATEIANKMAAGDLSQQIEHNRNDEIGDLNKSLLSMLINTAAIVARLKENGDTLVTSSKDLSASSQSLSSGTEQMAQNSQSIAASSTQMNQNLQVVSSSVEEMSISIEEVAKKASDAAKIAREANATAISANATAKELGENAKEIGKVIESIATIAAQTKLLALNAAIEAAGAGDAGKGFAVVASEVKELARQSSESSEEIKEKISAIQVSTENVVEAIIEITKIIGQVNEISSAIASAVEEQAITTKEIASNIGQTTTSSNDVTKNIGEISKAAQGGAVDASSAFKLAETLQTLSGNLSGIVGQFKISNTKNGRVAH